MLHLAAYIDISLAGRLVEPGIGHSCGSQESWCNTLRFYPLIMTKIAYHIAIENGPIDSWLTYQGWWFSTAMLVYYEGNVNWKVCEWTPLLGSAWFPAPWMMTHGSPGESLQAVRLQWCQSNSIPKYPNWPGMGVPSPNPQWLGDFWLAQLNSHLVMTNIAMENPP